MKKMTLFCCALMLCSFQLKAEFLKTVQLHVDGEIEVVPDMATISIGLNCVDKNIDKARNCLLEQSEALSNQLKKTDVAAQNIQTTAIGLEKQYEWKDGKQQFVGYECSMTYNVTFRDLKKLEQVYSALIDNEKLTIYGLQYTHSQLDSLKNEAYSKALDNANDLVDKLLQQLPETDKEILRISNVQMSSTPAHYELCTADAMLMSNSARVKSSEVTINSGTIKVEASLYVEFAIH